jgi:hypothetical protein
MKKIINLIVVCLLAIAPLQNTQAKKSIIQFDPIGVNIYNGTGSNASVYVSGPTTFSATLHPGPNSFGPITAGSYSVTISSSVAPHTYIFYGQTINNSSGSAVFNVNIAFNAFGSVN